MRATSKKRSLCCCSFGPTRLVRCPELWPENNRLCVVRARKKNFLLREHPPSNPRNVSLQAGSHWATLTGPSRQAIVAKECCKWVCPFECDHRDRDHRINARSLSTNSHRRAWHRRNSFSRAANWPRVLFVVVDVDNIILSLDWVDRIKIESSNKVRRHMDIALRLCHVARTCRLCVDLIFCSVCSQCLYLTNGLICMFVALTQHTAGQSRQTYKLADSLVANLCPPTKSGGFASTLVWAKERGQTTRSVSRLWPLFVFISHIACIAGIAGIAHITRITRISMFSAVCFGQRDKASQTKNSTTRDEREREALATTTERTQICMYD